MNPHLDKQAVCELLRLCVNSGEQGPCPTLLGSIRVWAPGRKEVPGLGMNLLVSCSVALRTLLDSFGFLFFSDLN